MTEFTRLRFSPAELAEIRKRLTITGNETLSGLACGYRCEAVPEEGEYLGERYTHRLMDVRDIHFFVVDQGLSGLGRG